MCVDVLPLQLLLPVLKLQAVDTPPPTYGIVSEESLGGDNGMPPTHLDPSSGQGQRQLLPLSFVSEAIVYKRVSSRTQMRWY